MSLSFILKQHLLREVKLQGQQIQFIIQSCLFFLMIVIFFPLSLPADPLLLRMILPGLVWIGVLLALFLSAERLFQQDYEDGVIEQWLASGDPLAIAVFVKIMVHGIFNVLPMLLFCPLLALLFSLSTHETVLLILSLICGTPAILSLCSLAAVFGTGLVQKGVFMALIVLPLTLPMMIFGSGVLTAAMQGLPVSGYLALLTAMSLLSLGLLPYAVAAVIRVGLVD